LKRKTAIFFYLLGGYVLLQFAWWAYHLIELTQIKTFEDQGVSRKVFMILSEGLVFFLIIMIGLWQIRKSIIKELKLAKRQKNFLLSVTHELKTPLAANKLFLQTIRKRDFDLEQRNDLLDKAISENVRLENMIDNILNATRLEHQTIYLNREKFLLDELLLKIVDRFEKIYQASNIQTKIDKDIQIIGDMLMIETIVVNLIENALKYAGEGAKIILSASKNNNDVVFAVEDNGPGVPQEIQKEIFDKFMRSGNEETRTKKGTGLGLYISKEFATLNGGEINYKNASPKGAIFEVRLKQ
jgi:signal transduction histidine kinase|tara:strand:- start:7523 stop:8419 length:897 start_codon:yes stop_codon:yes gene_type:complete